MGFLKCIAWSTDRWMEKQNVVCTCNRLLFSLKKKGVLSHATMWMNLEDIALSEISLSQKDRYCMFALMWGPWSSQIIGTESYWQLPGAGGRANGEPCVVQTEFQFSKRTRVLQMGCTTMWVYLALLNHTLRNVKTVNFMLYVFYLKKTPTEMVKVVNFMYI